jgi:hypothetical protein
MPGPGGCHHLGLHWKALASCSLPVLEPLQLLPAPLARDGAVAARRAAAWGASAAGAAARSPQRAVGYAWLPLGLAAHT